MVSYRTVKLTEKEVSRIEELFQKVTGDTLSLPRGRRMRITNNIMRIKLILIKGMERK